MEEDWSADDDGNEDRLLHLVVGESEDSWGATVVDRNDVDDGVVRWKASTVTKHSDETAAVSATILLAVTNRIFLYL